MKLEDMFKGGKGVLIAGTMGLAYCLSMGPQSYAQVYDMNTGQVQGEQTQEPDYSNSDVSSILGDRWGDMCVHEQQRARNSWNNRQPVHRQNIGLMYKEPGKFMDTMPAAQKTEFEEFKNAYNRAAANFQNPSAQMFISQGGKITQEYSNNFPWIDLDNPDYNDILLIFARERADNDTNGKRLNWNFIKPNGGQRQFGERGPLKIKIGGEMFFRQGNSNIYKSSSGKTMAVD